MKRSFQHNEFEYKSGSAKKVAPLRSYFSIISEAEPSLNGEKSLKKDFPHTGNPPVFLKKFDSKTSELPVRTWEGVLID
jgi:hypothetical protein